MGTTTAFSSLQKIFQTPAQQKALALETTVHNVILITTVELTQVIYFEKFRTGAKVQKNSCIIYRSHLSVLPVKLNSPCFPKTACKRSFLALLTNFALESSTSERNTRLSASSRVTCQQTEGKALAQDGSKQSPLHFPDALFQEPSVAAERKSAQFARRNVKHSLWNNRMFKLTASLLHYPRILAFGVPETSNRVGEIVFF